MAMNKNTVLAWATSIMIFVGLALIALGAFRHEEVAGWGFAAAGIGFFAEAWVFNALKRRFSIIIVYSSKFRSFYVLFTQLRIKRPKIYKKINLTINHKPINIIIQ